MINHFLFYKATAELQHFYLKLKTRERIVCVLNDVVDKEIVWEMALCVGRAAEFLSRH